MECINVTIYTDPGCPFGFNAQRQEAQLLWHYGWLLVKWLSGLVRFGAWEHCV
jgi:hypothetical protein